MMLLVATQEENFRKDLKEVVTQQGGICVEAENGEETLSQVDQFHPDIILLDLYLTKPCGLEVLRQLRADGYRGKVVVLGGPSVQTMTSQAFRFGASQIMGRPLDIHHAMSALRVAEGERNSNPDLIDS